MSSVKNWAGVSRESFFQTFEAVRMCEIQKLFETQSLLVLAHEPYCQKSTLNGQLSCFCSSDDDKGSKLK